MSRHIYNKKIYYLKMITNKKIDKTSFKIAKNKSITYWFTESNRNINEKDFETNVALPNGSTDYFELMPMLNEEKNAPRFVNLYCSASNSGKSYQVAQLVKKYLAEYPMNNVIYISANPLENDESYNDIKEQIIEIDPMAIRTPLVHNDFQHCLIVMDDTDSGVSSSDYTILDPAFTPAVVAKMTRKEINLMNRELNDIAELCSNNINRSILNMLSNGRKNFISVAHIQHNFKGYYFSKLLAESNIVLFPASVNKSAMTEFLKEKIGLSKEQIKKILSIPFYKYDFLYISHLTSPMFYVTPTTISILE